MEYNTERVKMAIPEYGRNVQRMIEFAISVKDRDERNRVARAIISVMGQLNPHLRDVTDFKHKLWDHLFIIADFKLDVDSPYPIPNAATFQTKPDKVSYPDNKIKYRHYGRILEKIIQKAVEFEEGDEKNVLTEMIANSMKKSYLMWNRDSVTDDVIFQQLKELSKGQLKLDPATKLVQASEIPVVRQQQNNNNKNKNRNRNNRHRNNRNRGGKKM
ncbi:MAG: DUF4290 domain-containing protein [Bacteroidia bacterium]